MNTQRKTDAWMSVPAAARVLGVTPPTVRMWAFNGKLRYVKIAGRLVIGRDSIEAYLKIAAKPVATAAS